MSPTKPERSSASGNRPARIAAVEGSLVGNDIEFNEDNTRTLYVIHLKDVTVEREDGSAEKRDEMSLRWTYSSRREDDGTGTFVPHLLDAEGNPTPPKHTTTDPWFMVGDPWYDILLPTFKAVGIDLYDFAGTATEGQVLRFERQQLERTWANEDGERGKTLTESYLLRENGRPVRDPDTDKVIYISDEGTQIQYAGNGEFVTLKEGEPTDERPAIIPIMFSDLLPVPVK